MEEPREAVEISFDEVNGVDLDQLEGLDEAGLRGHFAEVARRAKTSQLHQFLGSSMTSLGTEERSGMERAYVARRMDTVGRMLAGKRDLRLPIDE